MLSLTSGNQKSGQDSSKQQQNPTSFRRKCRSRSEGSSIEYRRNKSDSLTLTKRGPRLSSLSEIPTTRWQQYESHNAGHVSELTPHKETLGGARELMKAIDNFKGDGKISPIDGTKVIMEAIGKCLNGDQGADGDEVVLPAIETTPFVNGHTGVPGEIPSRNGVCSCCMRIIINVSGQIYETQLKTLSQFPDSLLGDPERRLEHFDPITGHYFFNRNRRSFDSILHYYQTGGKLRRPIDVPVDVFADEIKFFQLGSDAFEKFQKSEGYKFEDDDDDDEFGGEFESSLKSVQRKTWFLFERPESSHAARVVAVISVTVILLSVTSFCLETVPGIQNSWLQKYNVTVNDVAGTAVVPTIAVTSPSTSRSVTLSTDNDKVFARPTDDSNIMELMTRHDVTGAFNYAKRLDEKPCFIKSATSGRCVPHFTKNPFWVIETFCTVWFTIELMLRFVSCPRKLTFFVSIMNVIDLVSILPYFITTITNATAAAEQQGSPNDGVPLSILRVVRLVRVFRIFKLSRHSTGLRILGMTLSSSFRELGLLLFFVLIGVVIFSSAVYFAEYDPKWTPGDGNVETHFKSIPEAFWWAIVTMTTVGYGDMHPVTPYGRAVGSACAVSGILCLALPVPVIVSNFMHYYRQAVANEKRD